MVPLPGKELILYDLQVSIYHRSYIHAKKTHTPLKVDNQKIIGKIGRPDTYETPRTYFIMKA